MLSHILGSPLPLLSLPPLPPPCLTTSPSIPPFCLRKKTGQHLAEFMSERERELVDHENWEEFVSFSACAGGHCWSCYQSWWYFNLVKKLNFTIKFTNKASDVILIKQRKQKEVTLLLKWKVLFKQHKQTKSCQTLWNEPRVNTVTPRLSQ